MSAPKGELFPDSVDWVIVTVPKFCTAPPPFPPAVFAVNVLALMWTVASLSRTPPPGPLLPLNVSPVTVIDPSAFSSAPPP